MSPQTTSRKETAQLLTQAAIGYFAKKNYAVDTEVGVVPWGNYRADVYAFSLRLEVVVCEVKSCKSDFTVDDTKGKWLNYLPHCNKFYFVIRSCDYAWMQEHADKFKELGVGVMVLNEQTGLLEVKINAKFRTISMAKRINAIARMAWRNAPYSKRKGTRRTRVYIKED